MAFLTPQYLLGSAVLYISADTANFERAMATTQGQAIAMDQMFTKLALAATTAFSIIGVVSAKAAIDYGSSLASVEKTFQGTDAQLQQVAGSLRQMAQEIPVNVNKLNEIAAAAGQLKIKADNVVGFTKVVADLGVATNLSGVEAAQMLARFGNIVQIDQTQYQNLGSVIAYLGNNSAATESEIAAMALRIAGAGHQVGLTVPQIFGFSAALVSVGINAEAGGTAFSRVMIQMAADVAANGRKLEEWAKVAGVTTAQFAKMFREDASGAVIAFVNGLARMQAQGQDLFAVLESLGLNQIRIRDALLRSAGAGDLMAQAVKGASQAWIDNTALTDEANKRYATTASQLTIAKNTIQDAAITLGQSLTPALSSGAREVAGFADAFASMPASTQMLVVLGGAAASLTPLLLNLGVRVVGLVTNFSQLSAASKASVAVAGLTAAFVGLDIIVGHFTGQGIIDWLQKLSGTSLVDATNAKLEELRKKLDQISQFAGPKLVEVQNQFSNLLAVINRIPVASTPDQGLAAEIRAIAIELNDLTKDQSIYDRISLLQDAMQRISNIKLRAAFEEASGLPALLDAAVLSIRAIPGEAEKMDAAFQKAFNDASLAITDTTSAIPDVVTSVDNFRQALNETDQDTGKLTDAAKALHDTLKGLADNFDAANPKVLALKDAQAHLALAIADAKANGLDQTEAGKAQIKVWQDASDAIDLQLGKYKAYGDSVKADMDIVSKFAGQDGVLGLSGALDKLGVPLDDQQALWANLGRSFQNVAKGDVPAAIAGFDSLKKSLDPLVWKEVAAAIGPGLVSGIANGINDPQQKYTLLSTAAGLLGETEQSMLTKAAEAGAIGEAIISGLIAGMQRNSDLLRTTGQGIIQTLNREFAREAGVDSPSKLFADTIGEPIVEGIILGITNGATKAKSTAAAAASKVVQTINDVFSTSIAKIELGQSLEDEFGALGGKVIEALNASIADGAAASTGKSLATAVENIIQKAKDSGVPNADALGSDLITAVADAIQTKTPEAVSAVESMITKITAAMQAASVLTADTFANALVNSVSKQDNVTKMGKAGEAIMAALDKAITTGGVANIQSLADKAEGMVTTLHDKLPPEVADSIAKQFMDALNLAISDGGEAAITNLALVLEHINTIMQAAAYDAKNNIAYNETQVKQFADQLGISVSDVVANFSVLVESGILGMADAISKAPDMVKPIIKQILDDLNNGIIDAQTAVASLNNVLQGGTGVVQPQGGGGYNPGVAPGVGENKQQAATRILGFNPYAAHSTKKLVNINTGMQLRSDEVDAYVSALIRGQAPSLYPNVRVGVYAVYDPLQNSGTTTDPNTNTVTVPSETGPGTKVKVSFPTTLANLPVGYRDPSSGLIWNGANWVQISGDVPGYYTTQVPGSTAPPAVVTPLASGTDWVPWTGMYQLHQGERVVPALQNILARAGMTTGVSGGSSRVITLAPTLNFNGPANKDDVIKGMDDWWRTVKNREFGSEALQWGVTS